MKIHCIEMKKLNWKICRPDNLSMANTTDVWLIELGRLKAEEWIFLASNLTEDELMRSKKFQLESDRQRFIAGRSVLRQLLSVYQNIPVGDLVLRNDRNRKPYLENADISFNLTAAGNKILLAFRRQNAKLRIGVDLEKVGLGEDVRSIAGHYHTPPERALAFEAASSNTFFKLWARREALLQAAGVCQTEEMVAMDVGMRGHHVPLSGEGPYYIYSFRLNRGYVGSVAVEGGHGILRFFKWIAR